MEALSGRKIKIMTDDFNNYNNFLGTMMRAAGTLPFVANRTMIKKFNEVIEWYLEHNNDIIFFPEGSEWWCYEKPRPFMDGSFHYAAVNNVPIIPAFITFKKSGKYDKNGIEKRYFTVHFMEPIYPDSNLTKSENTKMLKEKNFKACCNKYEEVYGEYPWPDKLEVREA